MIIRFIKVEGEDFSYLEKKWSATITHDVTPYELALEGMKTCKSNPLPLCDPKDIPYNQSHLDYASAKADSIMPLIDGESLINDSLKILSTAAVSFRRGTVLLHRVTSHSESVYFIPCMRVIDGKLYHAQPDNDEERKLFATLDAVLLDKETPDPLDNDDTKPVPAPPSDAAIITVGAIASTIVLGIVSGAASKIGAKATSWALKELGIDDIIGASELSYDQLTEALKLQSRKDFRKEISSKFGSFTRLLDDYNKGFDLAKLEELYKEIRDIVSYLEKDYAEVDRVEFLALAQAQYLSIMQERAEQFRDSNPEQLKNDYEALVFRARKEAVVLQTIKEQAIKNRLDHITGVHKRADVTTIVGYNIAYFDDIEKGTESNWKRYERECTEPYYAGNMRLCNKYEPTKKGQDAIDTVQGRMDRHKHAIETKARNVLQNVDKCINNFNNIDKIEIPPAPPKKE